LTRLSGTPAPEAAALTNDLGYRPAPFLAEGERDLLLGAACVGLIDRILVKVVSFGVVGPKRASDDSTAPNPRFGARESINPRFPDPSGAFGEQAEKKQRSAMSVSSGVRDLPGIANCQFRSIAAEAPIPQTRFFTQRRCQSGRGMCS
jgi:hypothetical protein